MVDICLFKKLHILLPKRSLFFFYIYLGFNEASLCIYFPFLFLFLYFSQFLSFPRHFFSNTLFSPFIRDYHQITLLEPTFCFPWRLCPTGRKKFMLIFSPKGSLSVSKLFNFSSFSFHYKKKNTYNYITNNKNFTKLNIRINSIPIISNNVIKTFTLLYMIEMRSISFWISIYCYINIQ